MEYKIVRQERTNGTYKYSVFCDGKLIYTRPISKTKYPAAMISTRGKKKKVSFSSSGKFLTKGIVVPIAEGEKIERGRKRMGKRKVDIENKPTCTVSREDSTYARMNAAREALRKCGIFCTWKKMMQEIIGVAGNIDAEIDVLRKYVTVSEVQE